MSTQSNQNEIFSRKNLGLLRYVFSVAFFLLLLVSCEKRGSSLVGNETSDTEIVGVSQKSSEVWTSTRYRELISEDDRADFLENAQWDLAFEIFKDGYSEFSERELETILFSLRSKFDGDNFQEFWEVLAKLPNDSFAVDTARAIAIEKACDAGLCDDALNSVRASFGPGNQREKLIGKVFLGGLTPFNASDVSRMMATLESSADRNAAVAGLQHHLACQDGLRGIKDFLASEHKELRDAAHLAIGFYPMSFNPTDQSVYKTRLLEAVKASASLAHNVQNQVISSLINNIDNGEQAFALQDMLEDEYGSKNINSLMSNDGRNRLARLMVKKEPMKAVQTSSANPELLDNVFSNWINENQDEALNFYSQLEQGGLKDGFSNSLVKLSIERNEIETAQKWANEISNKKAQENALLLISKHKDDEL